MWHNAVICVETRLKKKAYLVTWNCHMGGKKWQNKGVILAVFQPFNNKTNGKTQMLVNSIDSVTGANQSAVADDFDDDRTRR